MIKVWMFSLVALLSSGLVAAQERQLLWGDTHLHTTYSSDAFANNNLTATPDTAYRFAKGEPVLHPYNNMRVQLERPLDFLVVSDHAEFLGSVRSAYFNGVGEADIGLIDRIKAEIALYILRSAVDDGTARKLFVDILPEPYEDITQAAADWVVSVGWLPPQPKVEVDTWRMITNAADAHNAPGEFSAIIGWEYSSIQGGGNLHRVVMSEIDAEAAQTFDPFGLDQSVYPEDLWAWLAGTSAETGSDFIAIPHNSNISKGAMFDTKTLRGEPYSAELAQTRRYWEPVVEITQIKGDSETHPALSPEDPFADFEDYPFYIQRDVTDYKPSPGDFIRSGLKRGLAMEAELGVNPFEFGVIGSTDSHTALSSADEDNFLGKMATDSIPENKKMHWGDNAKSTFGWAMSASGRAAVWAEDNSRSAIIEAMRRREVYATTGPRIGVRVYGGWDLEQNHLDAASFPANVSTLAVPMGELSPADDGKAPTLLIEATADPLSGYLDRVQIVKGWLDANGETHERIYDVVWAGDDRLLDDGTLKPVANTVDLRSGEVDNSAGASRLAAAWTDPDFDADQSAFYYVRVLQIPTARHSLYDRIALGIDQSATERPDTIQERAYTSAIWYRPVRSQ